MTRVGDRRLVGPALATWLAAAIDVGEAPGRAGLMCVVAVVVCVLAVAGRRLGLAAAALGIAAGSASAGIHVFALHRGPVAADARRGASDVVTMTLVRDPVELTSAHGFRFVLVDATVDLVGGNHDRAPVVVLAHGEGWLGLLPGQRVRVGGRLQPPKRGDDVAAVVLATGSPTLLGRPSWWQRAAGRVRAALRRACAHLPADERGLVPGIVLGDVTAMPLALTHDFQVTGLTHINAVSGENLAVVLAAVGALLVRLGTPRRSRVAVSALALLGFVVLARPSPSVLRAAVMGGIALVAVLTGRRSAALASLSAAVLVLAVVNPFLARTTGFALSVLATAAIVVVAPGWTDRLARRMPRPLAATLAIPAAAQLACTPVIVAAFGQLTPLAVPANLLAAPAIAPATLAGVVCALVAVPAPAMAAALAWVAALPAGWLAVVARSLAQAPGAGATWPRGARGVALLAVASGVAWLLARAVRRHSGRAMLDG